MWAQTGDIRVALDLVPLEDATVLNGACWMHFYSRLFGAARHAGVGRITTQY